MHIFHKDIHRKFQNIPGSSEKFQSTPLFENILALLIGTLKIFIKKRSKVPHVGQLIFI